MLLLLPCKDPVINDREKGAAQWENILIPNVLHSHPRDTAKRVMPPLAWLKLEISTVKAASKPFASIL